MEIVENSQGIFNTILIVCDHCKTPTLVESIPYKPTQGRLSTYCAAHLADFSKYYSNCTLVEVYTNQLNKMLFVNNQLLLHKQDKLVLTNSEIINYQNELRNALIQTNTKIQFL